jgi:hypothetical protein
VSAAFCALLLTLGFPGLQLAKEKTFVVSPDDLTLRLYQLLDGSYGGKLSDFYVLGDIYKDPKDPNKDLQHVFKVDYAKDRAFGKLRLSVRSVDKLTPGQLKDYNPQQVFEFGDADVEKFTKTDPGPFGRQGDICLRATADGALVAVPITEQVQKEYETYVTQWLLPALEKK